MAGTSQKKSTGRTSAAAGQKTTQKKTTTTAKKNSSQSNGSKSTSNRSTTRNNGSSRTSGSRNTGNTRQKTESTPSFVSKEITILITVAVCILLFLSNFGVCGSVGNAAHQVMCGVFGILGYVFPVYLFGVVLFFLSNRGNRRAMIKLAISAALFLMFCGLSSLMAAKDFDAALTVGDYYKNALEQWDGGAAGGIYMMIICPILGKIGAYIIAILLATIGIVFITEKSILQPISKGSRKVYHTAREDAARRMEIHAAKVEERKKYRLEQKVSGVALDTRVGDGQEEPEKIEEAYTDDHEDGYEENMAAEGSVSIQETTGKESLRQETPIQKTPIQKTPIQKTSLQKNPLKETQIQESSTGKQSIQITGLGYGRQELPIQETLTSRSPEESPIIPDPEDIIIAKKDTRTLSELEALDSLHTNIFRATRDQALWKEPEKTVPEKKPDSQFTEKVTPSPVQIPTEAGVQMHLRDIQKQETAGTAAAQSAAAQPAAAGKVMDAQDTFDDVKRVVTAGGKIVEVDVDPDDDPLTRKRIERRLAERAAAESAVQSASKSRGSQGDTIRLAGGAGGGLHAKPEPGTPAGLYGKKEEAGTAVKPAATEYGTQAYQAKAQLAKPPVPYVMPPYHLMKAGDNQRKNSDRELRETAHKLETTLQNFGVGVTVTNISCGPTVTRYELQPEQGVRVSKIVSLADDIKLNLAAADIRIEAPIPGKASIGIEVPNKENSTVFLRDVLESKAFREHPSKLAFAVGQDISGDMIVTDLAKMPHLLIAGSTGSGKSVCINTLIMSVLYKAKPEEVRLIMVDPKVVELSVYNGIPHLMIPVVTDPKKAAGALNWAVAEMTDRYRKFAEWNVRDLKGYNERQKEEAEKNGEPVKPLPQLIIIVDELADLMMVAPGEVEDAICRLAQMARAAGIHLVIATQRPSVNVITGLIKANVPSRIAFSVSSGVDSRTIIDMNGAEKLLGKGDMLFAPQGTQKPVRVQGAFVSDSEVSAVVKFLIENNQSQIYDSAIEARLASMNSEESSAGGNGGSQGSERDEYFAEAGRFIIEKQKASIGMLQRVFKIGFNRAARIMDQLAEAGVVSEDAGTKAREILMDMDQYEQLLAELGL